MTNTAQPNLAKLTIPELRDYIAKLNEQVNQLKYELELVNAELAERVNCEAAALFQKSGKTSGDVTFEADGVKLKASVAKTVKWDNDKLKILAAAMPWEIVDRVFDIKFSVPEATFKALPDPELVAKLEDARTVKYGEMTIKPI